MRVAVIAALLFVACGMEPEVSSAPEVASRTDALVLPTVPTEFARVRTLLPLRPVLGSMWAVIIKDPRNPTTDFLAWGFDVKNGEALFFVHGNIQSQWTSFNSLLANELVAYTTRPDLDWTYGMAGQIGTRGPPPPPPGGSDFSVMSRQAYDTATSLYIAQQNALLH